MTSQLEPNASRMTAHELTHLLHDVLDARRAIADHRGGSPHEGVAARSRMLSALETYTTALESQHLPVPYALRDELRIYRRLDP